MKYAEFVVEPYSEEYEDWMGDWVARINGEGDAVSIELSSDSDDYWSHFYHALTLGLYKFCACASTQLIGGVQEVSLLFLLCLPSSLVFNSQNHVILIHFGPLSTIFLAILTSASALHVPSWQTSGLEKPAGHAKGNMLLPPLPWHELNAWIFHCYQEILPWELCCLKRPHPVWYNTSRHIHLYRTYGTNHQFLSPSLLPPHHHHPALLSQPPSNSPLTT